MTTSIFFVWLAVAVFAFLLGGYLGSLQERIRYEANAEEERRLAQKLEKAEKGAKPEWMRSTQPQPGTAGWTIAAALNGVGCLGRSQADEPVFVLCARDKAASMIVREWATLAEKLGAKPNKTLDALALADRMEAWRERHGGGKVPD